MRVCLVSHTDVARSPRARALARSLVRAGHEVVAVCGGSHHAALPGFDIRRIPSRFPSGWGPVGWVLRRLQPPALRRLLFDRFLERATRRVGASLLYPMDRRDVSVATRAAGVAGAVITAPHWPDAGPRDIVRLAPRDARWSSSPAGPSTTRSTLAPRTTSCEGDRHRGLRIALIYRHTTTSPGRYLEAAMRRAGITVVEGDAALDWDTIPPDTAAAVFVESPYPAAEVRGHNPGIPVLFWVHHGEHHLATNLRLADRYRADAVLMAHSWHLAHRFPVPVHRFPFAVAPELARAGIPFEQRRFDIAMVGAGVAADGGRYNRRGRLVKALEAAFPTTSAFHYGIPPDEMADLYGNSRVVLNEGGDRHHPITMRVFEAIGAGALLLTDPAPGLDLLFDPAWHYELVGDDVAAQVGDLLARVDTPRRAEDARRHAMDHHRYDHRVNELVEIVKETSRVARPPAPDLGDLARAVHADVEVDEVLMFGAAEAAAELTDRVVWRGEQLDPVGRTDQVDAVVIGADSDVAFERAIAAARRYVYVEGRTAASVARQVRALRPDAEITSWGSVVRVALPASGYQVRPANHPLAGS